MDTTQHFTKITGRVARAAAALTISTLALTACGPDTPEATEAALVEIGTASETQQAAEGNDAVSEPAATVVETTIVPTTTTPTTGIPTTSAPTTTSTTTTVVTIAAPDDEGAYPQLVSGLTVVTSVGDPLNVRTGPGVDHDVVTTLDHLTNGIDATHNVEINSSATWYYIEHNGEGIGWVNASYLGTPVPTAGCVKPADFPEFEGAVTVGYGDVDLDGLEDEVFVLAEPRADGVGYNAWVLASFGNGGVATGQWTGEFDPTPTASVHVVDLSRLPDPSEPREILFQIAQGSSHGQWGVLGLVGCDLVSATLDGDAFGFAHGASAGHSTVGGCAYGAHGEIEFVLTSQNFNDGTWTQTSYGLEGTTWVEYDTSNQDDFPNITPHASTLADCGVSGY